MATLATKYSGIPASVVVSEHVFSAAGLTMTKLLANYNPGTLDVIIFLLQNYQIQEGEFPEMSPTVVQTDIDVCEAFSEDDELIDDITSQTDGAWTEPDAAGNGEDVPPDPQLPSLFQDEDAKDQSAKRIKLEPRFQMGAKD